MKKRIKSTDSVLKKLKELAVMDSAFEMRPYSAREVELLPSESLMCKNWCIIIEPMVDGRSASAAVSAIFVF